MSRFAYVATLCVGIGMSLLVHWKYQSDLTVARAHYRVEAHASTVDDAQKFENTFSQMYQGMRTMARLPGVQNIDRYAKQFSEDGKTTVQEIYNDLGANVAMSEVYIVPKTLEPDKIDSHTHALETPITTFDHLIIDRNSKAVEAADENAGVEQVEIYEYRLMKQQLAWMGTAFGRQDKIDGLNYPAISGPEVITCDNSRYHAKTPNDKDRSGLVYSIPFYAPKGEFKGCISGVILTHALRDLIPDGSHVFLNRLQNYQVTPNTSGEWQKSSKWLTQGQPSPAVIYSEIMPLPVIDHNGDWVIWAALPDSAFWGRSDVKAARQAMVVGECAVLVFTAGLIALTWILGRGRRIIAAKNAELEGRVYERTQALEISKNEMEQTVLEMRRLAGAVTINADKVAATSISLSASTQQTSAAADEIARIVASVVKAAGDAERAATEMASGSCLQQRAAEQAHERMNAAAQAVEGVALSARQMAEMTQKATEVAQQGGVSVERTVSSMQRIQNQVLESSGRVKELGEKSQAIGAIVDAIRQIAEQTNLLALNAAIEAARAGEHGRGFAVVADEVRRLAERSSAATQEIGALINSIQVGVGEAVSSMEASTAEVVTGAAQSQEAGASLRQIVEAAQCVASEVSDVTEAAIQMSASVNLVLSSVATVREVGDENTRIVSQVQEISHGVAESAQLASVTVQEQALGIEEVGRVAEDLSDMATRLQGLVSDFQANNASHAAPASRAA